MLLNHNNLFKIKAVLKKMKTFVEEEKGICLVYTIFPEGRQFKNWILISGEKIREAKRIIKSDYPYHLTDPFSKDKIERYLSSGILIETNEESAPTLKDGWSIRLKCEKINKDKLEEKLKHLGLEE